MTYHTERICETCLEVGERLHELDRAKHQLYSRKRRVLRNFKITRDERWETLDMIENTLSDLNITARNIRRDHAEHMIEDAGVLRWPA
jgi:hypothetical protein